MRTCRFKLGLLALWLGSSACGTAETESPPSVVGKPFHYPLDEELRLSWNAWQNAKQQVPIAKDYADRSAVVRTAYQEQFSIGERSLLDMLDSENEVFNAQRRYVEMQFTEMFTTYRINARIGDLLKQLNIQAPSAAQPVEVQQTAHSNLPDLK